MREATDLECLDAAAANYRRSGYGMTLLCGGADARRGVALVDAALVRGLREWGRARSDGNGSMIMALGVVAQVMLPGVGREARRRLER